MILRNESGIPTPPDKVIILFRRDLDGNIYYKSSDNQIKLIHEEDDIYKIQCVEGVLPFNQVNPGFLNEKIETVRSTIQEYYFRICEETTVTASTTRGRKGDRGATGSTGSGGG